MAKDLSSKGFFISRRIGQAIAQYDLINDGDRILVAVSGGKDSLTLLQLLLERRRWAPVRYEVYAAHITSDVHCGSCIHTQTLEGLFRAWGCEYRFGEMRIRDTGNTPGKLSCFWCSWNRRKELFTMAAALKCNKLAFGHHLDDAIETTLLNLFFNGEIATMNAKQSMFGGEIVIIRPLMLVEERHIRAYAKEQCFPSQLCQCPNAADSKRRLMKDTIAQLKKVSPYVKQNIFRSTGRIKQEYLGTPGPAACASPIPQDEKAGS